MEPDILGDVRVEPLWCVCCSHYVILEVSVKAWIWPFLWAGFLSFSEVIINCAFIFVISTRVPLKSAPMESCCSLCCCDRRTFCA